jgi:uncharacterized membrane protein
MRHILSLLKNGLVTGLLLLVPIGGTAYLIYWLVTAMDGLFPAAWRPVVHDVPLPGLGLIAFLVIAFTVGLLAHNFIGRRVVRWIDGAVQSIPVFGGTYGLIKQVLEAVFSSGGASFKRAVLVEYPLPGSWAIGFVTQPQSSDVLASAAASDVVSVFVPTCPNPTSGFFLVVEKPRVRELDMPVEQAFKLILSMGIADGESAVAAPKLRVASGAGK